MCRNHSDKQFDFASSVELTPNQAISRHLDIDWDIHFGTGVLSGHVDIHCCSQQVGECKLTLDTRDLLIHSIHVDSNQSAYRLLESSNPLTLGSPIEIDLPTAVVAQQTYVVRVSYSTTRSSTALQWLSPEQTTSKRFPFVFSQCQAIHARSLLPCQDLCQVKVTYSASVRYPSNLVALMSALRQGAPVYLSSDVSESKFKQDFPIPAYLIAVVCGELESRPIGPRSTVWAEPPVVDKAAWEFEDTERMIQMAEELCGPYQFGIYDLLVLPPSFPYGGMENPCLTFVTPTLIAGDRSQVAVIAHELAHSYSGNLVTNKTWDDFWLNEGLTVFTETKIVESLFGTEAASVRKQEGWDHLKQYVCSIG